MNGLPLLSATDQGEHDDDHHHHPQAQHAGVDVGGGGGDGDGDGCQDQQAQHDHPEDVPHPQPVGSVQTKQLSRHPAILISRSGTGKVGAAGLPVSDNCN